VEVGRVRFETGVEFTQNERYSISGREGNLIRIGVTSLHFGVGEYSEPQLAGVFQDYLTVKRRNDPLIAPTFSGDSSNDFGDLVLASRFRLLPEKGNRPALGFKFAVKLPNAKQDQGLGNDETEFFSFIIASKHIKSFHLIGNMGLAILPSPIFSGKQADLFYFSFGMIKPVTRRINLAAENNGRTGPLRHGNESQSLIRAGAKIWTGPIRWDVAGLVEFKQFDPDSGFVCGITYEFQAFHKTPVAQAVKLPGLLLSLP
jgi:hypothetical protein